MLKLLINKLNNQSYTFFNTKEYIEITKLAKENNLIIIRGYSDDNIEIEGALNYELYIPNDVDPYFFIINKSSCMQEDEIDFIILENEWDKISISTFYPLTFKYQIPNVEIFTIYNTYDKEGDGIYCLGLILNLNDLK